MNCDAWLSRWLQRVRGVAHRNAVLELGCGSGRDTAQLLAAGVEVVATDISSESLKKCALVAPTAKLIRADVAMPFPFRGREFDVIIASLCLHYFPWDDTLRILDEIARCIALGGLFIFRVNSTNDVNHGANSSHEIERNFFQVGLQRKRFFDRRDMDRLVCGWSVESLEEMIIHRYEEPKFVWEVVARYQPGIEVESTRPTRNELA